MAFEFTDSNFKDTTSKGVALVDFWAEWCGPCRMLTPIVEELSEEYEGKALVGKLNVDDNPEVAMSHQVRNIPTILIFKDGKLMDKQVGVTTKKALADKIEAQLQPA